MSDRGDYGSDGQDRDALVVVVGAGIAGLEAAIALHDLAPGRADVAVVAPEPELHLQAAGGRGAVPAASG